MNYTQLSLAIQQYVNNTESSFLANIPTFVKLAEQRIYNEVQPPVLRKNQTGTLTSGNKYLTLPSGWLATFSLTVIDPTTQSQTFLINKDVNFIREAYPPPNTTGAPVHYAQFDNNSLILGPTPDQSYGVELHFFAYPESIVTAGTSWLGDNFDNVLLYGAIREAYLYMKGEADLIAKYDAMYAEGLKLIKNLADGKNRMDTYRSGQVRIPVT
jgi:hypothetical protein